MIATANVEPPFDPHRLRAQTTAHPVCFDIHEPPIERNPIQHEELVGSIFENIDDALFLVSFNRNGLLRLEESNHACTSFFNLPWGHESGETRSKAVPLDFSTRLARAVRRCAGSGRPIRCDSAVRVEGKVRRWEFSLNPVHEAGATHRLVLGHGRDVTDHRQTSLALKRITRKLLKAQDDERRRIARELHDSTAQHLVALSIGIARLKVFGWQQDNSAVGPDATQRLIAEMQATIAEAHGEIRTMSLLLHPPTIDDGSITEALRRFVTGFARRTAIHATLVVDDGLACRSPELATTILRITQEALTNVYRHAGATRVRVKLDFGAGSLVLEVEDNGRGLASGPVAGALDDVEVMGVGIPGMRARVRQLHGQLFVERGRRGGTLVRAVIPYAPARLDRRGHRRSGQASQSLHLNDLVS